MRKEGQTKDVSNWFKVTTSTFQLQKNPKKTENKFLRPFKLHRQRIKTETFENINKAVLKWFTSVSGNNIPINGAIILEKTQKFAYVFHFKDFQASNGCLPR